MEPRTATALNLEEKVQVGLNQLVRSIFWTCIAARKKTYTHNNEETKPWTGRPQGYSTETSWDANKHSSPDGRNRTALKSSTDRKQNQVLPFVWTSLVSELEHSRKMLPQGFYVIAYGVINTWTYDSSAGAGSNKNLRQRITRNICLISCYLGLRLSGDRKAKVKDLQSIRTQSGLRLTRAGPNR